jgi:hypothetical protein
MGLRSVVILAGQHELEVPKQAGRPVDDFEVVPVGAGHDPHSDPSVETAQDLVRALEHRHPRAKKRTVPLVSRRSEPLDLLLGCLPLTGEIEGAATLLERELDEEIPRKVCANRGQHLAGRLEVERLGIDEDAVVVPEHGTDHAVLTAEGPIFPAEEGEPGGEVTRSERIVRSGAALGRRASLLV